MHDVHAVVLRAFLSTELAAMPPWCTDVVVIRLMLLNRFPRENFALHRAKNFRLYIGSEIRDPGHGGLAGIGLAMPCTPQSEVIGLWLAWPVPWIVCYWVHRKSPYMEARGHMARGRVFSAASDGPAHAS